MVTSRPVMTFETSKIVLGVLHATAYATTALRLCCRWRIHRLWWDDMWAFVCSVSDLWVVLVYMIIPAGEVRYRSPEIQIFWMQSALVGYTFTLWTARLAMAVAVVRLVNESPFRRLCKAMVWVFAVFLLGLTLQKIFTCSGSHWRDVVICSVPKFTAYIELSTDLLGDVWLIGAPVYMLLKIKLSASHRRLFIIIFGCGVFLVFSSVVHAYFIIQGDLALIGLTAHIQLAISIGICNLLVLVTWAYRVFVRDRSDGNSGSETSNDITTLESHIRRATNRAQNLLSRLRTTRTSHHPTGINLTDLSSNYGGSGETNDVQLCSTFPGSESFPQNTSSPSSSSYRPGFASIAADTSMGKLSSLASTSSSGPSDASNQRSCTDLA